MAKDEAKHPQNILQSRVKRPKNYVTGDFIMPFQCQFSLFSTNNRPNWPAYNLPVRVDPFADPNSVPPIPERDEEESLERSSARRARNYREHLELNSAPKDPLYEDYLKYHAILFPRPGEFNDFGANI